MKNDTVGIVGYGVCIPYERIATEEIARKREGKRKDLDDFIEKLNKGLLLKYKSIASFTEDTTTLSTEATENALTMAQLDLDKIKSVVVGTESKPYAVGLSARHAASFVGVGKDVFVADVEGACNAGMQSVNFVKAQVEAGMMDYGLAIGADISQAPKGDALEYSCGAGASAFVLGKENLVATIVDMVPCSDLFLDFFRRDESMVPNHFGRTTVDCYIKHVICAIEGLLRRNPDIKLSDFDYITFHQPSGYMPLKVCKSLAQTKIEVPHDKSLTDRLRLTFDDIEKKVKPWFRVLDTGNTYAASTMIAISSILDKAEPGQNILATSYGSGVATMATWIRVEEGIKDNKTKIPPSVQDYVDRRTEISFDTYTRNYSERISREKKNLIFPRIIGELKALSKESISLQVCSGCNRIYYPIRDKCLQHDCEGSLQEIKLPRWGELTEFEDLPMRKSWLHNYDVFKQGKVLIVDCLMNDLKNGMIMESVIRRLDYEGNEGLIAYGPCYRPIFRDKAIFKSLK
jgi:hydroxymethylglutaryl-CoA synthase